MGGLFRTLEPGEKELDNDMITDTGLVLRQIEETTDDLEEWRECKKASEEPLELTEQEKKEYNRMFIQSALKSSPELYDEIVGSQTSVVSLMGIITYEINASWWAGSVRRKWLQELSGRYFANKARRKWKRFLANVMTKQSITIPAP